jgi:hypothetical protein
VAAGGEHRLVIDRFEGDLAVVEVDGEGTLDLPRWILPEGVKEGDHLTVSREQAGEGGARLEIRVDAAAAEAARADVAATLERLKARDPGGDLAL